MSTDLSSNAVDGCTPETILGRLDEAICALNNDCEVTFVNEQAAEFLDNSPDELLGRSVWDAVPGITETAVGDELSEAMATQTPTRFESYNETLDRWVKVRIYPDEDGATACFYDITDERGRQLDLQRQRRLFETVFDETEDALVVADTDRRITDFNPAAEQLFGYKADEVIGEKSRVLYADPAVYDQQGEERFNEHTGRTEDTYQVEYERADGTTFIGETLGTPLEGPDDETLAFLGSIRDVSAQVEYEQALEATTQRLNIALEGTKTGVWEFRPATATFVWTDSMEQLSGFGLETYEEFLDSVHPDDRSEVAAAFDAATDPGDTFQVACRFAQADSSYLWIEVRAELLAGDDSPQRLVGIMTDISERKEREQQLRRERSRLRALFDSSPDGITIHDDEGSVIDMNETQRESLGFEWDDIGSLSVTAYEDDISLAELQTIWADMEPGEPLQVESTHRRQNGETFPVEVWVNKFTVNDEERFIAVARDITDRKQRDAELQRSKGFLERAQESAAIGGWEIDLEADSLRWTEEVYRIHDLPLDTPVSIDEAVEFYHPDDRPKLETAFERLTTDGESYDLELRIVTAEDRVRWVRTVADPQFDEEGEVVGVVGVFQDISEQKRLEHSLRESEQAVRELTSIGADTDRSFDEKLTALLELGTETLDLPIGFLNRLDDNTQHVQQAVGNHPAIQTGASAPRSESYCRKTVQQSGPLDVQDAAAEGWEGDAAYERFDLGCYIGGTVTVDGEMYGTLCFADHTSRAHEFSDNERAFVELLVQWISHELTRQAFETRLQDINETAHELMAVPDTSLIAALAVESTQLILDTQISGIWWYDEEQHILDPVLHTDAAAEHVSEQPVFEPGDSLAWEAFESGEMRVYNDLADVDGKHNEATIFESEVIVPLGDHGVLSASSLTPRAFSEADRNLLEVLASTIESALTRAEREMLLRETRAELEQSNEELEQFAYAASHDLQEPLRTVSSYLTLLERRYGGELDGDATEFIEFAIDGADRMQDMIQALLAYSRVDTSGESFEPVSVSTLFTSVTQSLDVKITEADATVTRPDTDATVTGDESQLAQLFQNLIENGIKYNTGDPEIDISVHRDETDTAIEITDNGIGIPADKRDGIFNVFQRLHTREEFTGTGIGLSICRKIVDRHDGDITVDSEPGVGSTFTITLPSGGAVDD